MFFPVPVLMSSEVMFGGSLLALSFLVIEITLQENLLLFKEDRRKASVKALVVLYKCFTRCK